MFLMSLNAPKWASPTSLTVKRSNLGPKIQFEWLGASTASIVPIALFQMLKHKVDLDMESHDKSTLSLDTAGCLIFTAAFQIPFPRRFRVLFQRPAQPGVAT